MNKCQVCGKPAKLTLCSRACSAANGNATRWAEAPSVAARFWARVVKAGPDECWRWNGCHKETGYAVGFDGKRVRGAHRIAYELVHGPLPTGTECRHKCDNRWCVNPTHLEVGTHAQNMQDMVSRQRSCRGEHKPGSKLTDGQVRELRRRRHAGERAIDLAAEFGITAGVITHIMSGRRWRHVA